jgi:hypothetical protein
MEKLFRYFVATSILLTIAYWLIPYVDISWLPEDELRLLQADGYKALIPRHPAIYWGLFFVWIFTLIGLLFFKKIARTAYFGLFVLMTLAEPFFGYLVLSPIEAMIDNILAVAQGAILAMAYLTTVGARFK